jgi:hypothetical protein
VLVAKAFIKRTTYRFVLQNKAVGLAIEVIATNKLTILLVSDINRKINILSLLLKLSTISAKFAVILVLVAKAFIKRTTYRFVLQNKAVGSFSADLNFLIQL